jgi:hypothetical protein
MAIEERFGLTISFTYFYYVSTVYLVYLSKSTIFSLTVTCWEPEERSRYSDWLRDGRSVGVKVSVRARLFSSPLHVYTSSEAHPAFSPMTTAILFARMKRPGREVKHSPTIVGIKNT